MAPLDLCGCDLHHPGPREAFNITLYSFLASCVFFVLSVCIGELTSSSAEISFAAENLIDALSSFAVLWRYWSANDSDSHGGTHSYEEEVREQITSFLLALSCIFLGVVMGYFSIGAMLSHSQPRMSGLYRDEMGIEIYTAVPSAIIGSALGSMQIFVGMSVNSRSLVKDGVISLFGALTSLGAWIGATADVLSDGSCWYIDPFITTILAFVLLIFGFCDVWHHVFEPWPRRPRIDERTRLATSMVSHATKATEGENV